MIQLYGMTNFYAAITNTAIAVFVFLKGRKDKLCQIWAIFTFCVAIYGYGAYRAASAGDAADAFFWWQFSYVGVILLPPLFLHFVHTYLGIRRPLLVKAIYIFNFAILAADIFSKKLFIGNVSLLFTNSNWFAPAWWVYPPGPLHIFHTIVFYGGVLTYSLILLVMAEKNATQEKVKQIKFFFIAMFLGFVGGGTSFLPCFGINLYPILNLTVPLYTIIVAYSIVRHNLLNIEVIIKKSLVFSGLFVVSYAIFASFAYLGSTYFEYFTKNRWLAMVSSVFTIVLILRPLENFLRTATDKFLFQKKYDYKHLLKTFTDEVITVLELSELVNTTVTKLVDIFKLENAAILLYDEATDDFRMVAVVGLNEDEYILSGRDGLVGYMQASGKHVLLEDFGKQKSFTIQHDVNIARLKASVFIPLMHQKKLVGVLSLGKKKSDDVFTQDDIDILIPLAKALSIAITNAQLFVKLSQAQANAAQKEKMAVIGTLSAGINHEICNPLGIARGQCEMFLLNMKEGLYKDKSQEELLEKAQAIMAKVIHETDRATVITRKLSSFAKPAKGRIDDNVKVEDEINEVISLLEHDLSLENITLHKDIEKGLPPISADRKQIQEIFFNIVRNAAQSIKSSGQIIIRAVAASQKVYVDIKDTGSGISKKNLGQIFDPFFTTKDPGQGTGLGLFIVKQIVEKNNGYISVQSELGMGTTFRLVFNASSPFPVESDGDSAAGPEEGSLRVAG